MAWAPARRRNFARIDAPIDRSCDRRRWRRGRTSLGDARRGLRSTASDRSVSRPPASRIKTGRRRWLRRRDGNAAHRVSFYRLGDESGSFRVFGEFAKVLRARWASLRSADRLLHRRETPFEHARAEKLLRVHHESGLEPGERIELVADEQLVGSVNGRRAEELGALEVARQVQVVGAFGVDGDANAFAVDVLDRADRRARRDEVARFDLQIRRAEGDLVRARGLVAEEGHVPGAGFHRVRQLSGGVEGNKLDGNSEPLAELAAQINRDAAG